MLKPLINSCLSIFVFSTIISCNNNSKIGQLLSPDFVDMEEFSLKSPHALTELFQSNDTTDLWDNIIESKIKDAYQTTHFQSVWYTSKQMKSAVDTLLNDIEFIEKIEGIEIEKIKDKIEFVKANKSKSDLDDIIKNDLYLSYIYTHIASKMLLGNKPPKMSKMWLITNDSIQTKNNPLLLISEKADSLQIWNHVRSQVNDYQGLLREIERWQQLNNNDQIDAIKKSISAHNDSIIKIVMTKELGIADTEIERLSYNDLIIQYQKKYKIKSTGKIDESTIKILKRDSKYYIKRLQLNLERLRWIPQDIGDEYIFVNIPLMELFYKKSGETLFHSNVIVGKSGRPTPSLSSELTDIVFNPPWGVPPTILKNDVVPGVSKAGGSYLARKGLRAYDSRGRDVTNQVNGSNIRNYRIAQPPGANNALGEIKFNFPNTEAIFIHDTNNRSQFNNTNRALSSGCIRTDKPKDLAEIILNEKGYNLEKINSIISKRKTEKVDVTRKIPIYILYLTTHYDEKSQSIIYLNDIYNNDKLN